MPRRFIVILAVMLLASVARAQSLPPAFLDAAVGAANAAIPGIGDPDRFEFQVLAPVQGSNLGCPLASGTPLENPVIPFIIDLIYDEVPYRVYVATTTLVVPCDEKFLAQTAPPETTGTGEITTGFIPAEVACPPDFAGYLPPRIQIGSATASVEVGGVPNRVRAQPSTETGTVVGEIQPGRTIDRILTGPACNQGFVWWEVEIDGVTGWTVESSVDANEYFIEPTPGNEALAQPVAPSTGPLQPISTANVANVALQQTLTPPVPAPLAWSADGGTVTTVRVAPNLSVLSFPDLAQTNEILVPPVQLDAPETPTALVYSPDGARLFIGTNGGSVLPVTLGESPLVGAPYANSHLSPVVDAAVSADGTLLATASGLTEADEDRTVKLWTTADGALLLNVAYPYPVKQVAFSANQQFLAVVAETTAGDQAGAIWVYDTNTREQVYSRSLASTGALFVSGLPAASPLGDFVYANGPTLTILRMTDQAETALFTPAGGAVPSSAAFAVAPTGELMLATSAVVPGVGVGDMFLFNLNAFVPGGAFQPLATVSGVAATDLIFRPGGTAILAALADGNYAFYGVR